MIYHLHLLDGVLPDLGWSESVESEDVALPPEEPAHVPHKYSRVILGVDYVVVLNHQTPF